MLTAKADFPTPENPLIHIVAAGILDLGFNLS